MAKIIKASKALQIKIGGPARFDNATIEKCQKILDENNVDFVPLGRKYLKEIQDALESLKTGKTSAQQIKKQITPVIMQIKATAPVMKYNLVGDLAELLLSFVESIKELDDEAIEILEANHKTLSALLAKNIKGNGGPLGKQLKTELENAFERHRAKQKSA